MNTCINTNGSIIYNILSVLLILAITYFSAKFAKKFIFKFTHKVDAAYYKFFAHLIDGLIYFFGISLAASLIPGFKSIALSLLASSGIIALIVGFASQQAFSNIISGIFLGIFRPFALGDRISVGKDASGIVEDITLRHTVLKTSENKYIIIPNSTVNSNIIENPNWLNDNIRATLDVYISYNNNVNKALELLKSIVESHDLVLKKPNQVESRIIKLDIGYINLQANFWTKNEAQAYIIKTDCYKIIKEQFDAEKIEFADFSYHNK